jgi:hypothetical protein
LCCHGWLSRFGSSAGELVVGRPRCTVWRVRRTMWRLPRSIAGRCRRARRGRVRRGGSAAAAA